MNGFSARSIGRHRAAFPFVVAQLFLAGCNSGAAGNEASQNAAPPPERSAAAIRAAEAGDTADANALANQAAAPAAAPPHLGACHGDECSWFRTQGKVVVRQQGPDILYRLSVIGGTAPDEENAPIDWDRAPHDVFIFCSRRLPAVILPDNGALQVDILDFVTGPTGPYETSANMYVDTCHPGEDWASNGFAPRHGYGAQDPERDVVLARPEDIFTAR